MSLAMAAPVGAGDIHTEQVQFQRGKSAVTITGSITGYQVIDYKLRARAGQTMVVRLKTDNLGNYFNLLAPGESDVAFFIGSVKGNEYRGRLPRSGEYTVRVYLMRNVARRGKTANFHLEIAIPATEESSPAEGDSGRAGSSSDFDATGNIPCARKEGQPMGSCRFGVVRHGGGSVMVRIFWPDGGERNLYYKKGKLDSSDSGAEPRVERAGDLNKVFLGTEERFEIPDAMIYGG
jgi:hypothetical protein